ncbi:MAG: hypothetical protein GY841_14055 [FCB group bacterium]|nr:hypothetical protein [FCB group bacterium]
MSEYETWQLVVQISAAVGTIVIAIIAIWGDFIKSLWAAPRLSIKLRNTHGEFTKLSNTTPARYYHLVASNARSWAIAKNAIVYLNQVEQPGPDGQWQHMLDTGPIPLLWQFGAQYTNLPEIGPDRICDLSPNNARQRY